MLKTSGRPRADLDTLLDKQRVRVPHGDVNCLPIPDSVPDEAALYLSDMLPTSFHCVVDTGVKEGNIVGVWGAGPMRVLPLH